MSDYVGRFAPSPTGPLHAGSLVAALASWLDARTHGGRWLLRIEDVDTPRCVPGAAETIVSQLQACGLVPDAPPLWQSQRGALYQAALDRLTAAGWVYPCGCSRKDIAAFWQERGVQFAGHAELPYPGTCRHGLNGKAARALRLRCGNDAEDVTVTWTDRHLGPQQQNVSDVVGDFVLRRADGLWAYQLAVVVDDADQGITHIVRGEDLADNTARQLLLQQLLGLPRPVYLHTPLVLAEDGQKLSKQNGAVALDPQHALRDLRAACAVLNLQVSSNDIAGLLATAQSAWRQRWDDAAAMA